LIKNQYGEYDFEPLDIKVPKVNLELNYGKEFADDVYKKIVHKLKNNNKGLYMFHGEPGTGKSSFIKYLTTVVKKEFIFVPTSFIERFISDPDIFAILLRRKNCVLILEDAEKILISRDKEDNQLISTLLNISDGILSDILEASVILTYNCDETKIDKALKRKGRTMVDYKFNKLPLEDTKKLAEHLKIDVEKIKEPMTLSEIYNMEDENKFYTDESGDNKRIIGFGQN
jgi:ATP-dependent 26S proteasome regulatory subunit